MICRFTFTLSVWFVLAGIVASQSSNIPEVLYLRFNEGSGTSTADFASPGVGSMPALSSTNPWVTTAPILGQASLDCTAPLAAFSAVCQTNGVFNLTGAWTIEVLIRRTGTSFSGMVNPFILNSNGTFPFNLVLDPANQQNVFFNLTQGAVTYTLLMPNAAPLGIDSHIAVVYDSSALTLTAYLNGVFTAQLPVPANLVINSPSAGVTVGSGFSALIPTNFPGFMDEVRIWSRARTQSEITTFGFVELATAGTNARSIQLAQPYPAISFQSSTLTATVSGTIVGVTLDNGNVITSPASDPIIGSAINVSGTYGGFDQQGLSDIVFANLMTNLVAAPGANELRVTSIHAASFGAGDLWEFESQTSALPIVARAVGQGSPAITVRIGSGSAVLDGIRDRLNAGSTMTFVCLLSAAGPRVRSIEFDYVLPQQSQEARVRPLGLGGVRIGVIGAAPLSQIYNVFAVNSPIPVGSGPLFGLEFGPFQLDQLGLPFPAAPFKVFADANGNYLFSLLNNIVSPGTVIDMLTATVPPGAATFGFITQVQRVTF